MNEDSLVLPELIRLESFGGDWKFYLESIYQIFKRDFVYSQPFYNGERIRYKRYPNNQGKESTFWHLISDGKVEEDRIPDLRRCERIPWPKPIVVNNGCPEIKIWENTRKSKTRILFWLEEKEYLVVLERRKNYLLLWTAYLTDQPHTKRKLQKEYNSYINANTAR